MSTLLSITAPATACDAAAAVLREGLSRGYWDEEFEETASRGATLFATDALDEDEDHTVEMEAEELLDIVAVLEVDREADGLLAPLLDALDHASKIPNQPSPVTATMGEDL